LSYVPSKLRRKIDWLFKRAEGALLPPEVLALEGVHLDPDGARLALRACEDDVAVVGDAERLTELLRAIDDPSAREAYVRAHGVCGVRRFAAGPVARIYQMTVETFPRHVNNLYAILEPGSSVLFDCGSGLPSSRRDLALGFAVVRAMYAENLRWESLDWCVVSHAHHDHFGGVNDLRRTSRAKLAVHELDARVIACFDERLVLAMKDIDVYWRRAGVSAARRAPLREMYMAGKSLFHAEPVDRRLRDGDLIAPGYLVHHVPGHCPGLICLQVHDVLLTSDHVLARITPHQFPQAITPFAGLEHYFRSLAKIRALDGIRLALGGHEEPIHDVRTRIDEIEKFHRARLERVREICATPHTVDEVSAEMFGEQEGYGVILAIDEAGAHVEYLHQLGELRVDNLDEVAASDDPVLRYVSREGSAARRPVP
jgi:glyoxylase-like metal-dependent hydrolase (beta-lactamase superfamily II)